MRESIKIILGLSLLIILWHPTKDAYSQANGDVDRISPMKCNISFFSVKNKKNRILVLLYDSGNNKETITGHKMSRGLYRFYYEDTVFIDVHLKRRWDIFKPLYNTHLISDTVSLLPIGTVELHCGNNVTLFQGYESAYCGPQIMRHKTYKYRSICSLRFEDYSLKGSSKVLFKEQ